MIELIVTLIKTVFWGTLASIIITPIAWIEENAKKQAATLLTMIMTK